MFAVIGFMLAVMRWHQHRASELLREREQIARAVHDSQSRYRSLFELSPDAIIVHREWRIVDVNARAVELLAGTDASARYGPCPRPSNRARSAS